LIKLAVIADDLTGANDTAVQFAKCGLNSCVLLQAEAGVIDSGATDVVVLDTDSRSVSVKTAYDRVAKGSRLLLEAGVTAVYKKIDSTLRGNIGIEIAAAADVLQPELVAIVPAFPSNCRITVGGYHLLQQVPISRTEIAQDPKTPVRESHVPTLLAQQTDRPIGYIPLGLIMAGQAAIQTAIQEQLAQGKQWVVFDAANEEDLQQIAAAAKNSAKLLWVGSAGLAEVLPSIYGWECGSKCQPTPAAGPVLAVVGSVSKVTRAQVATMLKQPRTKLVEVSARDLIAGTTEIIETVANTAIEQLRADQDVVITSSVAELVVDKPLAGVGERPSDRIAATLGKIGARVMERISLAGVYLTGGDTAINVCRATGASGMEVVDEVAVGIPLGRLRGGRNAGLQVVTKAGAFGDEKIMVKAAAALRGENRQTADK